MRDKVAIFVGPTAFGLYDKLNSLDEGYFKFYPPVKRGDLSDLPSSYKTVILVDGCFHSTPSVGHIEIRNELNNRTIYGCSSMGAIRAFEMRNLGMLGFGSIYEMFFKYNDFMDDELTQLHGPEPDYIWFSEPLVNTRALINNLLEEGYLTFQQSDSIIYDLKEQYFGNRTKEYIGDHLSKYISKDLVKHLLIEKLPIFNPKKKDFVDLLKHLYGNII